MFLSIINFYVEGFKNLTALGKKLWAIILIKLLVLLLVIKVLFYPNYLSSVATSDEEKANVVIDNMLKGVK